MVKQINELGQLIEIMVLLGRFELPTSSLPMKCSTPELQQQLFHIGSRAQCGRTALAIREYCLQEPFAIPAIVSLNSRKGDDQIETESGGVRRIRDV